MKVGVKMAKVECVCSTHGNLFSDNLCHESDSHVTRQAASDRRQNVWWRGLLQVNTEHELDGSE